MHAQGVITWTGLVYGLLVLVIAIYLTVIRFWPRDDSGSLMHPEEVEKLLSNFRTDGDAARGMRLLTLIIIGVAVVSLAFSKSDSPDPIVHDD